MKIDQRKRRNRQIRRRGRQGKERSEKQIQIKKNLGIELKHETEKEKREGEERKIEKQIK